MKIEIDMDNEELTESEIMVTLWVFGDNKKYKWIYWINRNDMCIVHRYHVSLRHRRYGNIDRPIGVMGALRIIGLVDIDIIIKDIREHIRTRLS